MNSKKLHDFVLTSGRFALGAIIGAWVGLFLPTPLDRWNWERNNIAAYEHLQWLSMLASALLGGWFWVVACRRSDRK